MKQKFRFFCKNKYHKFSSAVLLVLPDLRNSAFFIYRVNDERRCRNCTSAFLRSKLVKNVGQLPMYYIKDHHEGIVSREIYDAVQAETARRNALKSPSKKYAPTGQGAYASKYALSERLVCGECGTLYRRCTWIRPGRKRIVWRCISRLDYGKKYCRNSPTLDEGPLQQAILAALMRPGLTCPRPVSLLVLKNDTAMRSVHRTVRQSQSAVVQHAIMRARTAT